MTIIAIERECASIEPAKMQAILRAEAAAVWSLKKKEIIRDIWFTISDNQAVILLECANEEEAHKHLAKLPLVREGLIKFEVRALRTYDGFDRLIAAAPSE